jgi:hypothetical protein
VCRVVLTSFVRFRVGEEELEVAFMVALELAVRCERSADEDARAAAQKIRGAGASRPIVLSSTEQAALASLCAGERDAVQVLRRLLGRVRPTVVPQVG